MLDVEIKSWMQKIIYFLSSSYALTFLFIVLIVLKGMGQVAGWDLLQQVSMADSYHKGGSFYPAINDVTPHGVSPYFPGVALLALMLREIGIDFYVVEILILIACLVVLSFFYIQMKICDQILEVRVSWYQFAPFIIAFSLLATPDLLTYAVEFKPDIISLLFGFVGLFAAGFLNKKISIIMLMFGALLFSGAVIFKQQYIALVLGVLAFCFMFLTRERILFAFFTVFFTSTILFLMLKNTDLWFWNVHILSDDGFLSVREVVLSNYNTFKFATLSLLCCALFLKLSNGLFPKVNKQYLLRMYKLPWVWGAAFCVAAAFLSGLKVGGNAGNTQLGIFLFAPIIFVALSHLPRFVFTTLAWAAIVVIAFPIAVDSVLKYRNASNLRSFVADDVLNGPGVILTGSDVYFASRHYPFSPDSFDYLAYGEYAKAQGLPSSLACRERNTALCAQSTFSLLLPRISVDRLVVENLPVNKTIINSDSRYKIIFENKLGIVAERIR